MRDAKTKVKQRSEESAGSGSEREKAVSGVPHGAGLGRWVRVNFQQWALKIKATGREGFGETSAAS